MTLIRLVDKIINLYRFILTRKNLIKRFLVEILFVALLLFACYAPRKLEPTVVRSEILTVEKKYDSVSYLLKILEKKDSTNTDMLRHLPSLQPLRSKDIVAVSTQYGMRTNKSYGVIRFHDGIDFAAKRGTPIHAAGDGIVIDSDIDEYYGNHVQIDHGNGYVTFYGHMDTRNVVNGQKVLRDDVIGTVGSSGISTGYHVHFKISYKGTPINPIIFK